MEKNDGEQRRRKSADRISRLPKTVLCRILSFVSTKEAVATSVLSKRWTNLWLSVPNIEFTNIQFYSRKSITKFNRILNSILISRDNAGTPFNRFSIDIQHGSPHLAYKLSFPNVLEWIDFVAKRNLENLCLDLNLDDFDDCDNDYDVNERFLFKLPNSILNCRTLVILDLTHFTVPRYSFSSTDFGFPSLKKLWLTDVDFDGDFALFLSGCPILEDLKLFEVYLGYDQDSVTKFKNLNLPKMTRADITECMFDCFPLKALSTSESLCLDTFRMHTSEYQVYQEVYHKVGHHPLRPYHDIPIFHNLTYLKLRHSVHLVVQVLHHCPKLQNLKYKGLYTSNEEDDQKSWVEPESVPQCLLLHLRTCTIWCNEGLHSQLMLAKYILKNANVLQTMKISGESEKSKLSECPKASATCQLL